jgi:hypothetical protein
MAETIRARKSARIEGGCGIFILASLADIVASGRAAPVLILSAVPLPVLSIANAMRSHPYLPARKILGFQMINNKQNRTFGRESKINLHAS